MYKSFLSLVCFLLFSFAIGGFLTGCNGNSTSYLVPVTSSPPATKQRTFADPPLKLVGGDEGGGLCSWLIDLVLDGLKEGVTSYIGDNTTGRVLNDIMNHSSDPGATAAFQAMSNQLNQIGAQLTDVETSINSLISIVALNQATLTDQIDGVNLLQYSGVITNCFNTDPTGETVGTSDGYIYFGAAASKLDTTNTAAVTALQGLVTKFYNNNNVNDIRKANTGIYQMVVPPTNLTAPVLTSYAKFIAQSLSTAAGTSDSDLAYNSYKLLEQLFSQILNYQIQANIIIAELDNYNDPSGATAQADLTTFQNELKNEVVQFQAAVNYLIINLIDYRKSANYNNESGYMHTSGIAPDSTYNMVFARSRFFTAQLLNSFQKDFGLHGSIVTPLYNSPGPNVTPAPVVPVTIKFAGYTTNATGRSYAGYGTVTTPPVNPVNMTSRFPYTKWDVPGSTQSTSQSSADNNWSFYEFSAPSDVPAGRYAVSLVDNNIQTAPWYHTDTDLGTVSVLYYDPKNPGSGGTLAPTATNTFKFGSCSARWNWGFNRMSVGPAGAWVAPAKVQNFYSGVNYGLGLGNSLNNPFLGTNGSKEFTYSPHISGDSTVSPFNTFMLEETSSGAAGPFEYAIEFPFNINNSSLPGEPTSPATIFYNNTGTVVANNLYVNFDYSLRDAVAQTTATMATYSNTSGKLNTTVPMQAALSSSLKANNVYDVIVEGGLFGWTTDNSHPGSATLTLNWDMQVIYNFTLPLP